MKTILQNNNSFGKRARLFAATLIAMLFAVQTYAQQPCNAGFVYYTQSNYFTFMDSSYAVPPDSITTWTWSFGDGTGGSGQYVTHQYNSTGTFTACLTITTALGCSNTVCQTFTISTIPCNMTANIVPDTTGSGLYVAVSGGVQPISYLWSNGATTNYISNLTPGLYCVTVTDSTGCTVTDCDSSGAPGCSPYFIYSPLGGQGIYFQNYTSGSYTSLIWDFGDGSTSTAFNPTHTYLNTGTYTVCLTLYNGSAVCNQYCTSLVIQGAPNSQLCGTVFNDLNGNGIMDSNESVLSNQYIIIYGGGIQQTTFTDSMGNYSFNVPPGTYTISYCPNTTGALVTLPIDSSLYCGVYYNVTISANQTNCGYNFGVQFTSVSIEGTVFADLNTNGVYDSGEPGIPYQSVSVGAYTAYTNSNGFYTISVPAGTFSLSYSPSGAYSTFPLTTPGSISVTATTVGNTYSGNDFGINIPAGTNDISVQLLPHTTVTPGFPAWYDIYVCNYGLVPTAANVTMMYDPALTYTNAYPAYATINTSSHTITWTTGIIFPGNCNAIWVDFEADSLLALGVNTFESVTAFPVTGSDIDLSNNTDTVHQISIGSWDPNSKLSIKTNNNDPNKQLTSSANPDQEITYTVNFQNLGTAPAVNVIVIDNLSTDLDANSFSMVGSSHPCNVTRNGNQVTYTFSNIMLPDNTTNPTGSHGFVSFTANSKNNLPVGTILSDNASIYFDFNQPVVTGNTNIVLFDPLGINENVSAVNTISVYPNPVKESAGIEYTLKSNSNVKIEVIDLNGRVCQKLINENQLAGKHSITWKTDLNAGVYFIKLEVEGKTSLTKVSVVK